MHLEAGPSESKIEFLDITRAAIKLRNRTQKRTMMLESRRNLTAELTEEFDISPGDTGPHCTGKGANPVRVRYGAIEAI
jgi:hypothetical protein